MGKTYKDNKLISPCGGCVLQDYCRTSDTCKKYKDYKHELRRWKWKKENERKRQEGYTVTP